MLYCVCLSPPAFLSPHLSLPPPSLLSFTHTHTHTYIHTYIRTHTHSPPLQSWQYSISQMSGLMVYKQRSVLVKCIISASLLLDIHGFIYKSLRSTFFPVSMVYITGMPLFLWEYQIRIKI